MPFRRSADTPTKNGDDREEAFLRDQAGFAGRTALFAPNPTFAKTRPRVGEYFADYSELTAEKIAQVDLEREELFRCSKPASAAASASVTELQYEELFSHSRLPSAVDSLELELAERTSAEWAAVTAAYGTGGEHLRPSDILGSLNLTTTESWALGLHKPTIFRFDHANRKRLPWAEEYFVPPEYVRSRKIIAGSLNEEQRRALHECFRRRGYAFPLP